MGTALSKNNLSDISFVSSCYKEEHGLATVLAGAGQPRRLLIATFRNEGKINYKGRAKYLWSGTPKKHRVVLVHKVGYVPST